MIGSNMSARLKEPTSQFEKHSLTPFRLRNSFNYTNEIYQPRGQIDIIFSWCKTELVGDWCWELLEISTEVRPGHYIFYFDVKRDCIAFIMKWGKYDNS